MAYKHVTSSGAVNVAASKLRKVRVVVNTGFTGTITVSDETGTSGSPVVAVITNPVVGNSFEYYDMTAGVTVNPSATCDITVDTDSSYGPK